MAMPIFYSDVYPNLPTDTQFRDLISEFRTEPTFVLLARWSLMFSLYEGDPRYKDLQQLFLANIIRPELREVITRMAALETGNARPVFGRWQLLSLMKRVLLESNREGIRDPTRDLEAQWALGDACLMINNLIFSEEQMER